MMRFSMRKPLPPVKESVMTDAMDLLFESSKHIGDVQDDGYWEESFEMEGMVERVRSMLHGDVFAENVDDPAADNMSTSSARLDEVEDFFRVCNEKTLQEDRLCEYQLTEEFVLEEQNATRARHATARRLEAAEEKRLAADVAQLKGLRLKSAKANLDEELRWKIANAETAFTSRKMVFAKASQVAAASLRVQFTKVRSFLEKLHEAKQMALYREHRRGLNFQTVMHGLKQTDTRVVSLDRQISLRLFRKKKADLNELHMARTLEEAVFLESMMDLVDKVQGAKEQAAKDMFTLHVQHLKQERNMNAERKQELELFVAAGTLEMAKMVAQYAEFYAIEQVEEAQADQDVERIERQKNFDESKAHQMNTSKLYDTILWSAASNDLGLTSSGSSLYSSDIGSSVFDEEEEEQDIDDVEMRPGNGEEEPAPREPESNEGNSALEDNTDSPAEKVLTPVGTMHTRQLAKQLRDGEKALVKKHNKQLKTERRQFHKEREALKNKHQAILDKIIENSVVEREALRAQIDDRLEALIHQQNETTERMRKADLQMMKDALFAEDERVEEAENSSFRKAQELISAQVFHEVRNALSCVIAMSEMTGTLKTDESLSPKQLLGSVDGMLTQVNDVVDYSLKMLNEVLDVSKINSGAFQAKKEVFDLQAVVARATRMQQAKAVVVDLAFRPSVKPIIATSDPGIVERVVATMISNSVKFTHEGAIQPFVWPLEEIERVAIPVTEVKLSRADSTSTADTETTASMSTSQRSQGYSSVADARTGTADSNTQLYAVGVADTGSGLTEETLRAARDMISTSTSKDTTHGAQNTGFGLYHAHLQAKVLGGQLTLARLQDCTHVLSEKMLAAMEAKGRNGGESGKGTVLYFTVPVYKESGGNVASHAGSNLEVLEEADEDESAVVAIKNEYKFHPKPSPFSKSGCFRVLICDDMPMMRKGMVHTIATIFPQKFPKCPVAISTACSAEDMLRAVDSEPFDLVICDHHFRHDNSAEEDVTVIAPVDVRAPRRPVRGGSNSDLTHDLTRPCLQLGESSPQKKARRMGEFFKKEIDFFKNERFTKKKSDGSITGFDALRQLARWSNLRFPTPVLMLLSGHKIEINARLGIVVVQKPLRAQDFVSTLEDSAKYLMLANRCTIQERQGKRPVLVNGHKSQFFAKDTTDPVPGQVTGHLTAKTA